MQRRAWREEVHTDGAVSCTLINRGRGGWASLAVATTGELPITCVRGVMVACLLPGKGLDIWQHELPDGGVAAT